jgi:hypothetical protein
MYIVADLAGIPIGRGVEFVYNAQIKYSLGERGGVSETKGNLHMYIHYTHTHTHRIEKLTQMQKITQ